MMFNLRVFILCVVFCFICTSTVKSEFSLTSKDTNIDDIISGLTLKEKIGQMIMPSFRNWESKGKKKLFQKINKEIESLFKEYRFGGIILFSENLTSLKQTVKLTSDLQNVMLDIGSIPMFIALDQEGGFIVRLKWATRMPGNMAIGAVNDIDVSFNYGKVIAEELKALGINVDFAPSLDVNNNPNNTVIGVRSISSDPELVSRHGLEIINGIQSVGVIAVAKHFPGHGDTAVDSHIGLPVIYKSKNELDACELIPFAVAAQKVDMVMTAHIALPKVATDCLISKENGDKICIPSTFSKDILTDILRKQLKFEGVIITDALNMSAITKNFDEIEAVLMSIKSGVDIILMPTIIETIHEKKKIDAIFGAIERAIENGEISESRIDESVKRILKLKEKRGILSNPYYNFPLKKKNAIAREVFGSQEHAEIERTITQKSITVLKNNNILPIKPKANKKVLFLVQTKDSINDFKFGMKRLKKEEIIPKKVSYNFFNYALEQNISVKLYKRLVEAYDYFIVVVESPMQGQSFKVSEQLELLYNIARDQNKKLILLSLGKPYDVANYPNADAVLVTYASNGIRAKATKIDRYYPAISVSLDIIFGKVEASGKLPVDIVDVNTENGEYGNRILYPFGYGLKTNIN